MMMAAMTCLTSDLGQSCNELGEGGNGRSCLEEGCGVILEGCGNLLVPPGAFSKVYSEEACSDTLYSDEG